MTYTEKIYTPYDPQNQPVPGWRIEKRVANTDHWGVIGHSETRDQAIAIAKTVEGGRSTGVRIAQTDHPYRDPIIIVGV